MTALDDLKALGHEEVVVCQDAPSGLVAVVAIHDTTFGPAVGGTRMKPYPGLDAAVADALRLSRAMTYKAIHAGMERGGGKAVLVGDPATDKTRTRLYAYAKLLDRLDGRFHTGADMGLDARDVAALARMTRHITALPAGTKRDSSGFAALGVFSALEVAARWVDCPFSEMHVAVQGLGQVGYRLAELLAAEGVQLTVSDPEPARVRRAVEDLKAVAVEPDAIYEVEADVFSPNAMGGVLNADTVPRLRARAVLGAANEQLATPEDGDRLHERGVLYAPDYVVNAGGLLSLLLELGQTDEAGLEGRVRGIGESLSRIWRRSHDEGTAPHRLADQIAEERLAAARERKARAAKEALGRL